MTLADELPTHPRTGLRALGLLRDGQPIWPVLGGSGEDDDASDADESSEDADKDAADDAGSDAEGEAADGPDDKPDDADKPLGPAGEKALSAEKAKRRLEADKRRSAERERDEAKAELDKLRRAAERAKTKAAAKPAEAEVEREEVDAEEIQRKADEAATAKANERIIKAEVRASAAGKLSDPKDALKFLDLSKFEVDADGNVDSDEIDDAIADLLKDKPYLAVAQGDGKRFKGSGDGGAKPAKPARPRSLGEAVVRHYEK